jgi:hypothetical protein
MKAITLRKIPRELAEMVKERAHSSHTSFNKAVLSLLEERMGGSTTKQQHNDLDHLFGSWNKREASPIDKALSRQRNIDRELWK